MSHRKEGIILVADDEILIRELLVDMLSSSGEYRIIEAEDGQQALELFQQFPVDMVFTDLRMPRMNGMKLLSRIKQLSKETPVVILTGYGSRDDVIDAMRLGAVNFLLKPHEIDQVFSIASKIMRVRSREMEVKRIFDYLVSESHEYVIPSDIRLTLPLIDQLTERITRVGICDPLDQMNIRLALDEALTNSIVHGNLEIDSKSKGKSLKEIDNFNHLLAERSQQAPYCYRRVNIKLNLSAESARIVIQDEGNGFDWRAQDSRNESDDLLASFGRGLFLIRSFMDSVTFNDCGNCITLVKEKSPVSVMATAP